MTAFLIIVAIVIIVALIGISLNNGLVRASNACDTANQQVATQLQRRFDLIPNLVETVKGYTKHESETLQNVVAARTNGTNALKKGSTADALAADGELTKSLGVVFNAVGEAYPDLKANQNFLSLQEQLTTTENQVAFSRQAFNDAVLDYNNKVGTFPSSIVASIRHYEKRQGFALENDEARQAPKVQF